MRGKKAHPFNKYNQNKGAPKKLFKSGVVKIQRTSMFALGMPDVRGSGAGKLDVRGSGTSERPDVHGNGSGGSVVHGNGTGRIVVHGNGATASGHPKEHCKQHWVVDEEMTAKEAEAQQEMRTSAGVAVPGGAGVVLAEVQHDLHCLTRAGRTHTCAAHTLRTAQRDPSLWLSVSQLTTSCLIGLS